MLILKIANIMLKNNFLLSLYFMYMIDPFFLDALVFMHRAVYYVIAVIPLFLLSNKKLKFDKESIIVFVLFVCIILFAILCSICHNSNFSFVIESFKHCFKILCNIGLFLLWKKLFISRTVNYSFERIFANSVILYITFSLIFLVFPLLKEIWIGIIYNDRQPLSTIQELGYLTRFGIAGWSSFGEAFWVTFGLWALIIVHNKKEISNISFFIGMIVMFFGSFFYGRYSGVIFIGILLAYALFLFVLKKKIWMLWYSIAVIMVSIFAIGILYYCNEGIRYAVNWICEPLLNYIEGKTFSSSSTNELIAMYQNFKPTLSEWFIGSGNWNVEDENGMHYYGNTDVGYMRNVLFGGILFTLAVYTLDVYCIYVCFRKQRHGFRVVCCVSLFMILLISEAKGCVSLLFLRYLIPFFLAEKWYQKYRIKT